MSAKTGSMRRAAVDRFAWPPHFIGPRRLEPLSAESPAPLQRKARITPEVTHEVDPTVAVRRA
jgi:hypothetical protein